jgi:ribosomal protein L25 (general stress protein Ctc)
MMRGFRGTPVNAKAAFELAGGVLSWPYRRSPPAPRRKVPAVMYGGGEAPLTMVLDHNALTRQMNREAFYTSILAEARLKAQRVIVKDVQRHPAKP